MPRLNPQSIVPYPPINAHGVIGDRRTAGLVASDGTLDWLCLPDYDGDTICAALLDEDRGGFWKLGPEELCLGHQSYIEDTVSLVTVWEDGDARLELTDSMAWPETERPAERKDLRVIVRRLRCTRGKMRCLFHFRPRCKFAEVESLTRTANGSFCRAGPHPLWLWTSRPIEIEHSGVRQILELSAGEEMWSILTHGGESAGNWSVERGRELLDQSERYWKQWIHRIAYDGARKKEIRRSAITVHLLTYAPAGSVVAAPTTSLPERIGGDWNSDYRFSWVRDSSLSLDIMARLGFLEDSQRYLDWLSQRDSSTNAPIQIVYGIRGDTRIAQENRKDVFGYRGSRPVRLGNHAYKQHQHDASGYLLDCAHTYMEHGGEWKSEFWELIKRVTDFMGDHWKKPGNSIWELSAEQHFVSDRAMSWVVFDRAVKIAEKLRKTEDAQRWRPIRDAIHAETMAQGWSDRRNSFKQRYEGDNLDSSVLLIPLMGFLPFDHPRVVSTIESIAEALTINGLAYRFDPKETPGVPKPPLPLGEYEGAFLPCVFWLAAAFARRNQRDKAEAILRHAESVAGPTGLFAEAIDPRQNTFLGNFPLLFSHVTYIQAARELAGG